jgi:hypothetical protein
VINTNRLSLCIAVAALVLGPVAGILAAKAFSEPGPRGPAGIAGRDGPPGVPGQIGPSGRGISPGTLVLTRGICPDGTVVADLPEKTVTAVDFRGRAAELTVCEVSRFG